jgi:hypothetical protein
VRTATWVLATAGSSHTEAILNLVDSRIEVRVRVDDVVNQQRNGGRGTEFSCSPRYASGEQRRN